jgi:hypothetical protein
MNSSSQQAEKLFPEDLWQRFIHFTTIARMLHIPHCLRCIWYTKSSETWLCSRFRVIFCHQRSFSPTFSCPIHHIFLDLITLIIAIWWRVQIVELLIMHLSSVFCYSCPLDLNFLVSTLFSNTFICCSSLRGIDNVSHPYKTICKCIICIF